MEPREPPRTRTRRSADHMDIAITLSIYLLAPGKVAAREIYSIQPSPDKTGTEPGLGPRGPPIHPNPHRTRPADQSTVIGGQDTLDPSGSILKGLAPKGKQKQASDGPNP
jgi:hypothetical protein